MNKRSETLGILAVAVLVFGLLGWQFLSGGESNTADPVGSERTVTTAVLDRAEPGTEPGEATAPSTVIVYDRLISVDELPPEAIDTLLLIDSDGPFPYRKDGSTFQNREGLLPDHPIGWYREYTVETPGSPDRGARRIVGGDGGELFWTDDHYDSFRQIIGWEDR